MKHINDFTFEQYQELTESTAIYPGKGELTGLLYTALGLGEAGEIQGKVKKILRDSNGIVTEEVRNKITKELGDLLWYISQMCSELKTDMCLVAYQNIEKLQDRKERNVLQGSGDDR